MGRTPQASPLQLGPSVRDKGIGEGAESPRKGSARGSLRSSGLPPGPACSEGWGTGWALWLEGARTRVKEQRAQPQGGLRWAPLALHAGPGRPPPSCGVGPGPCAGLKSSSHDLAFFLGLLH